MKKKSSTSFTALLKKIINSGKRINESEKIPDSREDVHQVKNNLNEKDFDRIGL
jgi:hypothetical protein